MGHTLVGTEDDELADLWNKEFLSTLVQLMDVVRPARTDMLTALDLKGSTSGPTVYDMIMSVSEKRKSEGKKGLGYII